MKTKYIIDKIIIKAVNKCKKIIELRVYVSDLTDKETCFGETYLFIKSNDFYL